VDGSGSTRTVGLRLMNRGPAEHERARGRVRRLGQACRDRAGWKLPKGNSGETCGPGPTPRGPGVKICLDITMLAGVAAVAPRDHAAVPLAGEHFAHSEGAPPRGPPSRRGVGASAPAS
jgi:hypothetical protein